MDEQMSRGDVDQRDRTLARRVGGVLCVVLGAGMLLLFFWPRGEDVRLLMLNLWSLAKSWGLPEQVSPEAFAVVANGFVFVLLAFALTLLVRRISPWGWGLSGFALGGAIEFVQLVAMDARVPEVMDIAANGLGGMVGAALGAWALHSSARDSKACE
ncbi:VanZ family protein [Kocuria sp. M1R5S2]|uniref:VanZ family protein n=1 Tax=Kocuria rhizosphaerae TaxID=3376285 RepID=UPI0037928245